MCLLLGKRTQQAIRRTWIAIAIVALLCVSGNAFCQTKADDLVGVWESLDQSFKIDMFKTDHDYEAHLLYGNRVVEKDGSFKVDVKNPEPALRSRSLKGIVLIKGLVWKDGQWSGGTLYDGSSGSTYQCKAEVKNGMLLLRGFKGTPLFGETTKLRRANEMSAGSS